MARMFRSNSGFQTMLRRSRVLKTNLLLVVVWLVAIASCVAVTVSPGDCASAKKTWMGTLLVGCPN
jgi:hypothetical protein